jgi:hypothetical protein
MRHSKAAWPLGFAANLAVLSLLLQGRMSAAPFDAAPFGLPLPEGNGVMWEDPREIHRVVVHFKDAPPPPSALRLEYWGSWWPERHLPKDREPGGGDIGWMELGNWWKYNWRVADAESATEGNAIAFTFRPVNAKEFSKVAGYAASFRYTLKLRVTSDAAIPSITRLEAFTDSRLEPGAFQVVQEKKGPCEVAEVFNGHLTGHDLKAAPAARFLLEAVTNPDPNTFDRTLVTLLLGKNRFTFKFDDLAQGPLFLPNYGVAVLPDGDSRTYAQMAAAQKARGAKTLYDRVAELPEQTWAAAWEGLPAKKSHICFPLGLDGGRQRFRLNADGSIEFRSNDHYLKGRPGQDTPKLALESSPVRFDFLNFSKASREPAQRTLEDNSLPICKTTWQAGGTRLQHTALVTLLNGSQAEGPVPAPDAPAVFLARFAFTNSSDARWEAPLPLTCRLGNQSVVLRPDAEGFLWHGDQVRGQYQTDTPPQRPGEAPWLFWPITPGQTRTVVVKIPYLAITNAAEREALKKLDFETERKAVAGYWRRRLNQSATLITPEPMLNEFYRSHAMHLLVNCEREPNADRRFARVGSFSYGAYGNESCMMVADLERRGYHQEAQECLEAWLHYQGTVGLPGSFKSKEGVLYGAGGYEAGGYNQHHGWILWLLAEHYRFTRDEAWLRYAAPGMVRGADWIIRETERTKDRHELERGLLPAGSLEDIGDWWTWLSTSCYTWRGLDSAAWALEQIHHPEAGRVRRAADAFHTALLTNFRRASERSPVVRLRDGTAVPKIPSQVHRRGRSFGWICETLEGAMHLLITRALDPHSPEAGWILKDYEDNLYLSNQYGYTLDDFDRWWFGRGGMSMQACLLLGVEPYLYRDDVKQALRALFNAQAVSYFPDVRMNTEHALPEMGDWRGDHFKSSDESNTAGWLRYLFIREEGDQLLVGQAVPRDWLKAGKYCGLEKTSTWFGPASVLYTGGENEITAQLKGPRRNPPKEIRLRFREPQGRPLLSVTVNGKAWKKFHDEWVMLPGDVGVATVQARYSK